MVHLTANKLINCTHQLLEFFPEIIAVSLILRNYFGNYAIQDVRKQEREIIEYVLEVIDVVSFGVFFYAFSI